MGEPLTIPHPDEIAERIRACRTELASLRKLHRLAVAALDARATAERRHAEKVSKKLGRKISEGILMLATLMESEAGDQPDLAKVAIAHAAITNAKRTSKNGSDLTAALKKLLLPSWQNHKITSNGHMGSQQGGRYASTRIPPTERDVELAEAIAKGQIQNPAPGAIKWDSPSAQDKLHDEGLYDSDSDAVADNRENKEHLIATYLPGIDHGELRLWRTAA